MTYNTDRKNLIKRDNTWWFRKTYTDKNGVRHWFQKSLKTHSLPVARKHHDEIMGRWDEVVAGDDFEWKWEGEYNRTTVKERRLDEVVEKYIKHKQADGLAETSIMRIRNSLDNLINYLGSGFNYTAINSDDIDNFKRAIASDRTPAGVNVDIRNIRAFCNWLFHTERISRQLPIKQVKEPRRKPQYLTEDDIKAIFSLETLTDQMKRFYGFYLATGLRRSAPFFGHMEGNWLVIPADAPYNKSKRELEVCLDSTLHEIWLEMMDVKRAWGDQGKQFRNLTGKITKEFKRAVRECGIDGKHHLHNTRHTFAIRNWLKSNNIYEVKEQLGHSTVSVTEGYAKHKRSKISADFPTLTKQIAEVPKSLELVEGVQINVYNEDERLS
jgi:site-specific recombinase XerD